MNCKASILAIDCGWANIGLAVIVDSKIKKVGLLSAKSFVKHFNQFEDLVIDTNPESIILEKPFYSTKTLSAGYKVIETIGLQKYVAELHKIPVVEYSALETKKYTGNAKNNKKAVMQYCLEKNLITQKEVIDSIKQNKDFTYKPELEYHIYDAIILGYYHLHKL